MISSEKSPNAKKNQAKVGGADNDQAKKNLNYD